MRLWILLLCLSVIAWAEQSTNPLPPVDDTGEKTATFMQMVSSLLESSYMKDAISFFKMMATSSDDKAKAHGVHGHQSAQPLSLNDAGNAFAASFSRDAPALQHDTARKSIKDEDWAKTLFGERGVLTGIFQVLDQQRKVTPMSDPTTKINGKPLDFDFKHIFDSLVMGSTNKEFGDPGPELPEFLGICNRLSCGDIYKAIDKFRRSDLFSNFQTALTLIQDPNGWETIGKLLSNPELIAQFTAGSGMEEVFGSALGQAKIESTKNKEKSTHLMPEDGDFGTDFTELVEEKPGPPKEEKPTGEMLPETSFSIDQKSGGGGGGGDSYYESVAKVEAGGDGDVDIVDVDEKPPPPAPSTTTTSTTTSTTTTSTTTSRIPSREQIVHKSLPSFIIPKSTPIRKSDGGEMQPDIAFSIDSAGDAGDEEEEQVVVDRPITVDVLPPRPRQVMIIPQRPPKPLRRIETVTSTMTFYFTRAARMRSSTHAPFTTTTRRLTTTTTTPPTSTPRTTSFMPRRTQTQRSTTNRPSTTAKNYRKDSDYYAMYYDT